MIGTHGQLVAGIMEAEIRLRPVAGGSIPATLKVVCNIGPAGPDLDTGQPEGFTLDVGGLSFTPLAGNTIFTNRPPFG